MVHRTLNITQRSRGKVSGASGKILDPHHIGKETEAGEKPGSHLQNLSQICLKSGDRKSRVPQAPGCLSSLVHCDTLHQLRNGATEERKLIKCKLLTSVRHSVQKSQDIIPSPNCKSPLTSKTKLRPQVEGIYQAH